MFWGEMRRTANASSVGTQVEFGDMEIGVCLGKKYRGQPKSDSLALRYNLKG